MHNVGRIYILTRASGHPSLFADQLTHQSIVRDWHTNVAKALLENWQVADEIIDAVSNHEDMNQRFAVPDAHGRGALASQLQLHITHGALIDPTEPLVGRSRLQVTRTAECHRRIRFGNRSLKLC
jgi:HD-like signal output (HDOD) protein